MNLNKRLTDRQSGGICMDDIEKIMEKLKFFEDTYEDGKLLILPCKIGDEIYYIEDKYISCSGCPYFDDEDSCEHQDRCPQTIKKIKFQHSMIPFIRTSYFLTKEEAEKEFNKYL